MAIKSANVLARVEPEVKEQAEAQIQEIVHYISHELNSPNAALHLLDTLEDVFSSLMQFPHRITLVNNEL